MKRTVTAGFVAVGVLIGATGWANVAGAQPANPIPCKYYLPGTVGVYVPQTGNQNCTGTGPSGGGGADVTQCSTYFEDLKGNDLRTPSGHQHLHCFI